MKLDINSIKQNLSIIQKNKLAKQLILAISTIVLLSSLLIALIFLTQCRSLSLKQAEKDFVEKVESLIGIGENFFDNNYDLFNHNQMLLPLGRLTDADLWIVSLDGGTIISTTNQSIIREALPTIIDDISNNSDKQTVNYHYSKYFGTKTLTVIVPINRGNQLIGAVLLHKDVNIIFNSYSSLIILIMVSIFISLTLSIILGILYSYKIIKPVEKITEVANKIGTGNYKVKTEIVQDDEIGLLAKTIDNMANKIDNDIEEIKKLEASAKELVANVSHEFKTPLTLIRGYVENLQDGTLKNKKETYQKIINNTAILEKLVNELLDLSKYQSGKMLLKLEELEFNQLIKDVIVDMQSIAKSKDIIINFTSNIDNKIIEADYTKLRQLFTIFIDNAIKYSSPHSDIEINLNDNKVIIKDNGIGMDKEEVDKIFDRFYQVDNNKQGYGLGLCIAKYIIDMHHYKVDIKSKKGKGTSIIIEIS